MKAVLVLFAFLTAWVEKDFKKAIGYVSKTWADKNKADDLKSALSSIIPDGFDIGEIKNTSTTTAIVEARLKKDGKVAIVSIGMVCESWPGKADPFGDWGVLPDSFKISAGKFKKDEEEETKIKAAEAAKEEAEKLETERLKQLDELRSDAEKYGVTIAPDSKPVLIEEAISDAIEKYREDLKYKAGLLGVKFTKSTDLEKLEALVREAEEGVKELMIKAEDLGIEVPEGTPPEEVHRLIKAAENEANK